MRSDQGETNLRYLFMALVYKAANFRLLSLRIFLGPLMLGVTLLIFGYSGTLKSFLTVTVMSEPINKIAGRILFSPT